MASKNGTGNQPREKMSKRILVVDDESDVCMALEKILDEHGFMVDSYKNPLSRSLKLIYTI